MGNRQSGTRRKWRCSYVFGRHVQGGTCNMMSARKVILRHDRCKITVGEIRMTGICRSYINCVYVPYSVDVDVTDKPVAGPKVRMKRFVRRERYPANGRPAEPDTKAVIVAADKSHQRGRENRAMMPLARPPGPAIMKAKPPASSTHVQPHGQIHAQWP